MQTRLTVLLLLLCIVVTAYPVHATAPAPGPLGWLIIPGVLPYAPIYAAPIDDNGTATIEDDYHQISDYGVGHLEGTAWIDDGWGRVVLAGHNPGVFAPILTLQVGDRIIIVSHLAEYEFKVTRIEIVSNNRRWLAPTDKPTLTLITCEERGKTWRIAEATLKD